MLEITCAGYQAGPFQVVIANSPDADAWLPIGPTFTNNSFKASLTNVGSASFFRVRGPAPAYAGANLGGLACNQCHSVLNEASSPADINHDFWAQTPHAHAFQTLIDKNPANATNASCFPCHTVGYGYVGGFSAGNQALEGVQCENCHGPGGVRHKGGGDKAPAIERSAMVCGGCHNNSRYLTYDEWKGSGHATTDAHVAELLVESGNQPANLFRCGSCHSGAMRSYLMSSFPSRMPEGDEAAREGIVCVACHDPHRNTTAGYQLRNPLYSTNAYSVVPATNWSGFLAQYDADVNLCGQCHNARGAVWTDTARPPHASPQYNALVGAIGEVPAGMSGPLAGGHALLLEKQCASCHMPHTPAGTDAQRGDSGHGFQVTSYNSCMECHPLPEMLATFTVEAVADQIQEVKQALDYWAVNRAPDALRQKYGVRAWEFTSPGELSNSPGTSAPGPGSAEQALIPDSIKKARFNLYLVQRDGSLGIHNGPWSIKLLDAARAWVQGEVN